MQNHISGKNFIVKNIEEKKEIIRIINEDVELQKFFKCLSLHVERFTGKIQGAVLAMKENPQKIMSYEVSGSYPNMTLTPSGSTSSSFVIKFPETKKQTEVKIEPKEIEPIQNTEEKVQTPEPVIIKEEPVVEKIEEPEVQTKETTVVEPVATDLPKNEELTVEDSVSSSDDTIISEPTEEDKVQLDTEGLDELMTEQKEEETANEEQHTSRRRKKKNTQQI